MADCLLPRDSAEELMAFFRWAAERRSEDDSSFLTSLRRASSTLMASTRDEDLTERAEVKLALSELNPSTPWEPQTPTYGARCPRRALTPEAATWSNKRREQRASGVTTCGCTRRAQRPLHPCYEWGRAIAPMDAPVCLPCVRARGGAPRTGMAGRHPAAMGWLGVHLIHTEPQPKTCLTPLHSLMHQVKL